MPASFSPAQEVLSKNPVTRSRTRKGALSGVSFLLVTSSLDKQRKVTRPPAGGRNARRAGEQSGDNAKPNDKVTG
jgi:hypothetical protein